MTFGINADFDGYPDVDVLSGGIRRGIEQLLALATKKTQDEAQAESAGGPAATKAPATARPAKKSTPAAAR
jgi:hypothetical protein